MRDSDSGNQKKGQFRLKKYTATLLYEETFTFTFPENAFFTLKIFIFTLT